MLPRVLAAVHHGWTAVGTVGEMRETNTTEVRRAFEDAGPASRDGLEHALRDAREQAVAAEEVLVTSTARSCPTSSVISGSRASPGRFGCTTSDPSTQTGDPREAIFDLVLV